MTGPSGPVHFIHLGGSFTWQHRRAVETAKLHGSDIVLWSVAPREIATQAPFNTNVEPLELPDWLRDHPIKLANVKDLYAWRILHEHGGLYLDLDTISLAPVWDLLTREVLVSMEHDETYRDDHPYNSAVVAGRKGSDLLAEMEIRAGEILHAGVSQWGACGPRLLTETVAKWPDDFDVAPFGVLNGWRDGTIHEYYEGVPPPADCRVVHLFSSSNMKAFEADRWMP